MPRASPEHQIQKAVVDHLRARRKAGVWFCAVPNDGKRSPVTAARMKARGLVPGAPDIVLLVDGNAFGLELKAPGGRLSMSQVVQRDAFRAAGGTYEVATGIDEALRLLVAWDAIRPDARLESLTPANENGQAREVPFG